MKHLGEGQIENLLSEMRVSLTITFQSAVAALFENPSDLRSKCTSMSAFTISDS